MQLLLQTVTNAVSQSAPAAEPTLTSMSLTQLAQYAGPVALAAFAGVFLGGLCLSFFWKNFGPWQMLEACRRECAECANHRELDALERQRNYTELADVKSRYDILLTAVNNSGLGLRLSPNPGFTPSYPLPKP